MPHLRSGQLSQAGHAGSCDRLWRLGIAHIVGRVLRSQWLTDLTRTRPGAAKRCGIMAQLKLTERDKTDLVNRLKRAEGQMRGVQRMIEDGRDCEAILQQLTAVRSALHTASLALARAYATQCLVEADDAVTTTQMIDALMGALGKLP